MNTGSSFRINRSQIAVHAAGICTVLQPFSVFPQANGSLLRLLLLCQLIRQL